MTEAPGRTGPLAQLGPEIVADPYGFYEMVRSAGPVAALPMFGAGGFGVTGHSTVNAVLRSKHFGREAAKVVPPDKLALIPQEQSETADKRKGNMLFRDPPVHTRLRSLVNQAFTPRTVEHLRPHISEIAEHLIDAAASRGSMDLIQDFAFPLPVIVIAEMLGVPPGDRDAFKHWSTDLIAGLNPAATAADLGRVVKSIDTMDAYMSDVIEERRRAPRADLISDLVRAQEAGDRLSQEELVATCRLLLTAGHETTVNLIGNGSLALLRHPEERAALAADPSLLPNAVEELLRFDSPVQMTVRFVMEPVTVTDHAFERGDIVLVLLGAANRDPEVFPEPARLDLRRANASSHVSLGAGIHYCLGAPLARLEGQVAIGALLRRLPGIDLAAGASLEWRPNLALRGLKSLPVRF
jgi:cytochrome P450